MTEKTERTEMTSSYLMNIHHATLAGVTIDDQVDAHLIALAELAKRHEDRDSVTHKMKAWAGHIEQQ